MSAIIDAKLQSTMIAEFTLIAARSSDRDLFKLIIEFGKMATEIAGQYNTDDGRLPNSPMYNPGDVAFKKKSVVRKNRKVEPMTVPESAEMSNCSNLEHGTPEIKWSKVQPLWTENKTFDISKYYYSSFSNPVSTSRGNCGGKCVQTEVWLINIKSGKFETLEYEFASMDDLVAYLTPFIENGKQFIQPAQIEQTKPIKKTLSKEREMYPSKIKLSPKEQELREFLIANPDATRHDIAAKFDVTVASADTMKWSLRKKLELSRGLKK